MVSRGLTLMPWPLRAEREPGHLPVEEGFRAAVEGRAGERVYGAATRSLSRIARRSTVFLEQGRVTPEDRPEDADLVIRTDATGRLALGEDEAYRLRVSPDGARLEAPTELGALRGLQTFVQLLEVEGAPPRFPSVTVEDRPRFPWRGLMLDVARHFLPVSTILRNVEAMARLKLNVLHLHLTDDQGFRVESSRWPDLHREGSDGEFYSHEQIREIVAFAAERGIRVVPEFDVPGHATSWFVGHPELAASPGPYRLQRGFGIFRPVFDPTREETYRFLQSFLEEMAELFPDEYVHLGGDEVKGRSWREEPRIRAYVEEEGIDGTAALQAHFLERLTDVLRGIGKTPVIWEGLGAELPRETVVQAWKGRSALARAVRRGQPALLSRGYYLDLMRPAERHNWVDPLPLRRRISPEERGLVLGGEAAMWGEHVDHRTVDSRVWPRAAAVAERLWSPASVTDTEDMYRRLDAVSVRLDELGLRHLSGPRSLLGSLAGGRGGERMAALRLLAGLSSPVEGLRWRHSDRRYTVHSPLSRFVDATVADPPRARRFRREVERFFSSGPRRADPGALRSELTAWLEAEPVLRELVQARRPVAELEPLVDGLEVLARRGLEAVAYRSGDDDPPPGWARRAYREVRKARSPAADVRLRVVHALTRLIDGAA